jgi:hypothetical protein
MSYKEAKKGDIVVTNFGKFVFTGERYSEKLAHGSPWGQEIEFLVCEEGDIDCDNIIQIISK